MSETRILSRLLRMYFSRNWEFGSALSKLRNLWGGCLNPQTPPSVRHWTWGLSSWGGGLPVIHANAFWGSKAKGSDVFGDPGADLMPILKRIPNWIWMFPVESIHAGQVPTADYLDTLMTSQRGTTFRHQLSKCQVLNGEGVSYWGGGLIFIYISCM
jgi:hypothetical protein